LTELIKLRADDWDVSAHERVVIVYLRQDDGAQVAAWLTPDQAAGAGMRLIQAAYAADAAVCTKPGSGAALAAIDEVLAELDEPARAVGVTQ
jgi:hypothetical protein